MESIERAIRNAFAKTDAGNPAARQRIYESAWGAHERALAVNASLSDAQKEQRRLRLKEAISAIEEEFSAGRQAEDRAEPSLDTPHEPSQPHMDDPVLGDIMAAGTSDARLDSGDIRAPVRDAPNRDASMRDSGRKQRAKADSAYEDGVSRKGAGRRGGQKGKKPHSPFYSYGIPALVLAVAAMIGYSLYNCFSDLDGSQAANPLRDASMPPLKNGEEPGGTRWITIFNPAEATRMTVHGRATADLMRDGTRSFARLRSPGPEDTVSFDVGEGILDQIAGKKATFDIVAKVEGGTPTQMSVSCDFGSLGNCDRRRYDVTEAPNDFLFDIDFSGKQASGAGSITITSDLGGTGRGVDLYEIRVSTTAN